MLQTNDIGEIFAQMRAAYGNQWSHGADAIPMWQRDLRGYTRDQVLAAILPCTDRYRDYPPTIGQFRSVCESMRPRASTYLPAPPMSPAKRTANAAVLRVLMASKGVDSEQLKRMQQLADALVMDLGDDPVTEEWARDVEQQLRDLAANHDRASAAAEMERSRERFAR